jgi:putative ABC transport system permease protein
MLKWIKIAFRNILKNKRRSFVTLLAIALGFAAVSLFRGYTHSTYDGLRRSTIRGRGLGHLTIFKKGWLENGKTEPDKYMLGKEDIKKIMDIAGAEKEVVLCTPELHISGLVTNGRVSAVFIAKGVIPKDERTIKGSWAAVRPVTGEPLQDDKPYGVEMAEDLARHLKFRPKSDGVIMATTLDGQMNALQIEVAGVYNTGVRATNDKMMSIPFAYAQQLYDTEKTDRIIVLLDDWKNTANLRDRLKKKLKQAGLPVEIKTWQELAEFYQRVKRLFDMIFTFIFSIVLVIVVMSVINTMGMAVLERTREIGTLRALGLKKRGVSFLFALEGTMLGFMGCVAGILMNIAAWGIIRYINPTYIPPGNSVPVPLNVDLVPEVMALLLLFLVLLSLMAAILPARRAARQNIVESLGYV